MTLQKKNVGIFIFEDAEVLDFAGPFEVFSVTAQLNNYEPFNVFTIAKTKETVTAVNGLKLVPDYSIGHHPPIDVLIVSGGSGTRAVMKDPEVLEWVRHVYDGAELTLSICSASRIFGVLGTLDGNDFCTHHQVYEHMYEIAPKAKPQKERRFIKTTDKLFTSGGISAGIDLSFFIVANLLGRNVARKTAEYMEYSLV
jgi:transcriptional regulator GlxA family with amidase domain